MKVLLTAINSKFTHISPVPFYLRESIADLKCNVKILQFNINQNYMEMLSSIVLEKPDVVGFSVYIWNSLITKSLILDLKKILPETITVVGGPEASFNKEWINFSDYLIQGSGEQSFRVLSENNFNYFDKVLVNKSTDFNSVKFPYKEEDLSLFENKYVYYEASRGCPYKCSYCISSREDMNLCFRTLEKVYSELNFLMNSKCKVIKFVDRSFNCNREFSRSIWKYLIENHKENVKVHFEIYPALLEEEDFEILRKVKANYFQFEIGIQSVNVKTLREINRNENPQKVRANILKLKEINDIHIHLDLIAGLPFEGIEEVKKSFNEIYTMNGDHFQAGFLKILPGTEIEEKKEQYGIECISDPPYTVLKTKWLSFLQLNHLRDVEEVLEIYSNSNKFKYSLDILMRKYENSYDFFSKLVVFFKKVYGPAQVKGTNLSFKALYEFCLKYHGNDLAEMNDSLRIDWFETGSFINVPEYLKTGNEGCRKLPEFINNYIKVEIESCRQRAYLKFISNKTVDNFQGKNFLLFYREGNNKVKKVFF